MSSQQKCLVHGVRPTGGGRLGRKVREEGRALLRVVVEHVHDGRAAVEVLELVRALVRVRVHERGDGGDARVEAGPRPVVGVGVQLDEDDGHHVRAVARGGARGRALLLQPVLQRLEGVVDLAALARGVAVGVRVLVHLDDHDEECAAVARVAQDPQAVREAVGRGVALAPALHRLGGAEPAAPALVALVGREGRAVGVRDQRQQLAEHDVLPPLGRRRRRVDAGGRRLGVQARFAPCAQPIAAVSLQSLPVKVRCFAVHAVSRPAFSRTWTAAMQQTIAVFVGNLCAWLARAEKGLATRLEPSPVCRMLARRAHPASGPKDFGISTIFTVSHLAIVCRVGCRVGRISRTQRQVACMR